MLRRLGAFSQPAMVSNDSSNSSVVRFDAIDLALHLLERLLRLVHLGRVARLSTRGRTPTRVGQAELEPAAIGVGELRRVRRQIELAARCERALLKEVLGFVAQRRPVVIATRREFAGLLRSLKDDAIVRLDAAIHSRIRPGP